MDTTTLLIPHPPGATTGTEERPPQRLGGAVLSFDLTQEVAQLHAERAWHTGGRNAKTLVKEADFTVVLIALRRGGRLAEHRAGGQISVQTLAGQLRLHLSGAAMALPTGRLVSLERALPHELEALEDSAFLLTIGRQEAAACRGLADDAPGGSALDQGGRERRARGGGAA